MMAKPLEPAEQSPSAPKPTAATSFDGIEEGRSLGRQYLPDLVKLLAGIALAPESEASLHTRFLAANALIGVAGVLPQPMPLAPSVEAAHPPSGLS